MTAAKRNRYVGREFKKPTDARRGTNAAGRLPKGYTPHETVRHNGRVLVNAVHASLPPRTVDVTPEPEQVDEP